MEGCKGKFERVKDNEEDVVGKQGEPELGLSLPFPCPATDLQSGAPG